jgi:4-alpha-glucanotransferase
MQGRKPSAIEREAQERGIQTSYIDNVGKRQFASEETLRMILECLGPREPQGSLRVIEPVIVRWQNSPSKMTLRLPVDELTGAVLKLRMEDGEEECIPARDIAGALLTPTLSPPGGERGKESFPSSPSPIRGESVGVRSALQTDGRDSRGQIAELTLDVPALPTGYHSLTVESGARSHEAMLISAPGKLYSERPKQWGAFLPMYAAHSERSWGAGNFSDYRQLCEWLGALGGKVMGTLPLLSAFLDKPICEPSPYSPSSRLFWNEFFIDITAVPEFQNSGAAKRLAGSTEMNRKIAGFRASEFIDYKDQWAVRKRVLEVMAREFFQQKGARFPAFQAYLQARPEVEEYARFRAACDYIGVSWRTWGDQINYASEVKNFYLFIQWLAQEQMNQLLKTCRGAGVKFYLDLPLGVNADGFDAWRYRDLFAQKTSAGAPPDSFFTRGQDWGFAPLHPERTRELKYRYVIEYLRFHMRHTGLLRIDHVMGLHRLWWVPQGCPASAGAYVRYPAEELYAILSVESARHRTVVVGENLGTVPPEVNKSMDRHGVQRMYVLQYEQQPKGAALRDPEPRVVASVNTHDMPAFAAHWKGLDIDDRADLGLIPPKNLPREKAQREKMRQNLVSFLQKKKLLKTSRPTSDQVFEAVLRFLAKGPAETVLVTLEDLWGEERSQNVPGTSTERPNWKRKAARRVEEIRADRKLQEFLKHHMQR